MFEFDYSWEHFCKHSSAPIVRMKEAPEGWVHPAKIGEWSISEYMKFSGIEFTKKVMIETSSGEVFFEEFEEIEESD